jgi:hypothetical protein
MKKHKSKFLLTFLLSSLFFSCNNKNTEEQQIAQKTENLGFEDMPNSQTKSISIHCNNEEDNLELFTKLKTELEKNDFKIKELERNNGAGFLNCKENTIISMKGSGIRSYFARSSKPEKNTVDFFPDFNLQVFEFPNEKIALEKFELMDKALHSGGRFCNGKAPQILAMNKNEVFLLGTRAEMFRGYINDYAKFMEEN